MARGGLSLGAIGLTVGLTMEAIKYGGAHLDLPKPATK